MKVLGNTRILAVFGDPIAHSLSPLMQNEALDKSGINAVYVPFHIKAEGLGEAVAAVRSFGIWGVNLTVPHKVTVCPFLDELDADARLIGAVNTIVNRDGWLIGYNTDVYGFLNSLAVDLHFDPAGKRILLLGAGGACRAAVVALCRAGARWVGIANRTPGRAEALVADFVSVFTDTTFNTFGLDSQELEEALEEVDLLVNTTSVGLKGESFPAFPWSAVPLRIPVLDIVYSTSDTPFVASALIHGHPATSGLGMLAGQGAKSFQLWTGLQPPVSVMRNCLLKKNSRGNSLGLEPCGRLVHFQ
jgi:shikimate dehydrogenase